jgi:hypothetical protein
MEDVTNNFSSPAYVCACCNAAGVKLWRIYGYSDNLRCCDCSALEQSCDIGSLDQQGLRWSNLIRDLTDQIGGRIPAVPTGMTAGDSHWSYGKIPEAAYQQWQALPNRANKPWHTSTAMPQLPLTGIMPPTSRPTYKDPAVVRTVAEALAPQVAEWAGDGVDENLITELENALRYSIDGYEMAKSLERTSYFPDAALVEILDEAAVHSSNALDEAQRKWMSNSNLQPLTVGSLVSFRHQGVETIGEVVSNNVLLGKSTVFVAALGHVRSGTGTHGFVVNWEDLKSV